MSSYKMEGDWGHYCSIAEVVEIGQLSLPFSCVRVAYARQLVFPHRRRGSDMPLDPSNNNSYSN